MIERAAVSKAFERIRDGLVDDTGDIARVGSSLLRDTKVTLQKGAVPTYVETDVSIARSAGSGRGDCIAGDPGTSGRLPALSFESYRVVDSNGSPVTRRTYSKQEFIEYWENKFGREMTHAERDIIDHGCIGVTALFLGHRRGALPNNLAFGDIGSHRIISEAEKVLAPGDLADARIGYWRKEIARSERSIDQHGMDRPIIYGNHMAREPREYMEYCNKKLEKALVDAAEIHSRIPEGYRREMIEARSQAKIEGNERLFTRISGQVSKFNEILQSGPDVGELTRLVKADLGVDVHLPAGDLSNVKAHMVGQHYWSGQTSDNIIHRGGRGSSTPDAARFAPHPITGHVDMSGYYRQGKPGYTVFDYGYYDEGTASFWSANHNELYDPDNPLEVYQSTPAKFLSGSIAYDSTALHIIFGEAAH
ncbi:hypothetical protein ABZV91_26740 [Nocardia sp. NPDC004568]|uniref:hypothetical protein n=1 Tax=Nocardia sp. NPDC004568 TaxID=3154551 RepID=UPI0033A6E7E1